MRKKLWLGVLIVYAFFTIYIVSKLAFGDDYVIRGDHMIDDTTVVVPITETPLQQKLEATNLFGARIYISKDQNLASGELDVEITNAVDGHVLYERSIPVSDISIDERAYLDVTADQMISSYGSFVLQLQADQDASGKIYTYALDENTGFFFKSILKQVPDMFIVWIYATGILFGSIWGITRKTL